MKKIKLSNSIKWLITIIVSVGFGTSFTGILEKTDMNVWIARIIGCSICVVITLLSNHLWLNNSNKKESK